MIYNEGSVFKDRHGGRGGVSKGEIRLNADFDG